MGGDLLRRCVHETTVQRGKGCCGERRAGASTIASKCVYIYSCKYKYLCFFSCADDRTASAMVGYEAGSQNAVATQAEAITSLFCDHCRAETPSGWICPHVPIGSPVLALCTTIDPPSLPPPCTDDDDPPFAPASELERPARTYLPSGDTAHDSIAGSRIVERTLPSNASTTYLREAGRNGGWCGVWCV